MNHVYKKGSKVSWKWGKGKAEGVIEEIYHTEIKKQIKQSTIKRNATKENPAFFIKETGKDAHVLKLKSELLD